MSALRNIDVKAPHIQELQQRIQLQLAHHNYSAHDDPVMAEYIVVMLANQKTADQVTSELNELVGEGYDPAFTDWIWTQTQHCIDQAENPQPLAEAAQQQPARRQERRRRSRSPAASGSRRDERRSRSPPPSYSRHREDVRVRGDAFDGEAYWRQRADERSRQPRPPVQRGGARQVFDAAVGAIRKPAQNSKELFPESTAEGLSIFGRAGIPDPRAAPFTPSNNISPAPSAEATSILARIDPMLPNNSPPPTTAAVGGGEVGHSSDFPTEPSETSICRWNLGCTNPMCAYSHASPSNAGPGGDPNALVLSQQICRFGARCTNKDCTRSHVSPAVARLQRIPSSSTVSSAPPPTQAVLSMDAALPSQSSSRPCRFGAACTRHDCFFSHPPQRSAAATPCRFGLGCTRPDCYFTHPPGQRAAATGGTVNRLQVFAQKNEDDEMETIIPGANASTQPEPLLSS